MPGSADHTVNQPISLWWAALAAAEETMQGGPLVPAWLRLFSSHLSTDDVVRLRWGGDLAESAELRRAYSALYGRYFARALLTSRVGLRDFVPFRTKVTRLPNGVTIERIDEPGCVRDGRGQFARVIVKNAAGARLATKDWVAANLWSTDQRKRESVSLLWDPRTEGERISEDDSSKHANGIRRRHLAGMALRLQEIGLLNLKPRATGKTLNLTVKPTDDGMPTRPVKSAEDSRLRPVELPAKNPHSDTYIAALLTPWGVRPIRSQSDVDEVSRAKERASRYSEPALLFGISATSLIAKISHREPWISGSGIASPDGLSLFSLTDAEVA